MNRGTFLRRFLTTAAGTAVAPMAALQDHHEGIRVSADGKSLLVTGTFHEPLTITGSVDRAMVTNSTFISKQSAPPLRFEGGAQ